MQAILDAVDEEPDDDSIDFTDEEWLTYLWGYIFRFDYNIGYFSLLLLFPWIPHTLI